MNKCLGQPLAPRFAFHTNCEIGNVRKTSSRMLVLLLGLMLAIISPSRLSAQVPASFQGLGQIPGEDGSFALGVSNDGSVVVGYGVLPSGEPVAFRWSAVDGMQPVGNTPYARKTSSNGSLVVGQTVGPDSQWHGYRWTAAAGMEILPLYDALDVSADGNVVVALALRWAAPGTVQNLGTLGGGYTSAEGISANGQIVIGWSVTSIPGQFGNLKHAFFWTAATGMQDIGALAGGDSLGHAISGDGNVIVGEARDKNFFWHAFRWTATTGMQDLKTLGGTMSAAHGASLDGSVIVGKSLITSATGSERAFRWTTRTGMGDLRQELLNAGVAAVQNWILSVATDVSADGTVIVGYGLSPTKRWEAFRAVLPIPR
jgi:probable HAF family extracellular repeat protein